MPPKEERAVLNDEPVEEDGSDALKKNGETPLLLLVMGEELKAGVMLIVAVFVLSLSPLL